MEKGGRRRKGGVRSRKEKERKKEGGKRREEKGGRVKRGREGEMKGRCENWTDQHSSAASYHAIR